MLISEELKIAKDIIQLFLKTKKIIRMYPSNNPIYINTLEENSKKLKEFFYYKDELVLKIKQNDISYDADVVYSSTEKEDNLALFFFKDGLREITFKKGLTYEEMEDFLKIISLDFSREVLDDDMITLFWEKDFQNIHYVVDDVVLADEEDPEMTALMEKEQETEEDNLLKAYEDAAKEEIVKDTTIVPLSDKDLQSLIAELEKDSQDKTSKLIGILLEMFYLAESPEDYDDITIFLVNAIEFAVGHGDIQLVTDTLSSLKNLADDTNLSELIRKNSRRVISLAGSESIINLLGEVLDQGQEIEENLFEGFVRFLDRNAIIPFMKVLGELKSIHARKVVIDALVFLGTKDITTLAKGLNDSRWYVVRNIIYILRKIGDKKAVDYLLKTVRHGDIRVRKEVIRALGELGGAGVLQALRDCLDDPDSQVRTASLNALGSVGSEAAKRIVLNKIADDSFKDKDFDEKKQYFEIISRWKDNEILVFLLETLKKSTFFGRSRNYENRACAAYGLGLLGNKEALPILEKFKGDSNKIFREHLLMAIKRLEYGQ